MLAGFPSCANTMLPPSARPKLLGPHKVGQKRFIHEKWSGTNQILFIHNRGHKKMTSPSVEGEMLDYTEELLEEILKDGEKFERVGRIKC